MTPNENQSHTSILEDIAATRGGLHKIIGEYARGGLPRRSLVGARRMGLRRNRVFADEDLLETL